MTIHTLSIIKFIAKVTDGDIVQLPSISSVPNDYFVIIQPENVGDTVTITPYLQDYIERESQSVTKTNFIQGLKLVPNSTKGWSFLTSFDLDNEYPGLVTLDSGGSESSGGNPFAVTDPADPIFITGNYTVADYEVKYFFMDVPSDTTTSIALPEITEANVGKALTFIWADSMYNPAKNGKVQFTLGSESDWFLGFNNSSFVVGANSGADGDPSETGVNSYVDSWTFIATEKNEANYYYWRIDGNYQGKLKAQILELWETDGTCSGYIGGDNGIVIHGALAETLDLGSNLISNVLDPVDPQDAATKQFVLDSVGSGGNPFAAQAGDPVTIADDTAIADYSNTLFLLDPPSDTTKTVTLPLLTDEDIGKVLVFHWDGGVGNGMITFLVSNNVNERFSGWDTDNVTVGGSNLRAYTDYYTFIAMPSNGAGYRLWMVISNSMPVLSTNKLVLTPSTEAYSQDYGLYTITPNSSNPSTQRTFELFDPGTNPTNAQLAVSETAGTTGSIPIIVKNGGNPGGYLRYNANLGAGAKRFGTATLVNGTVTVSTTAVTANSLIFLTIRSAVNAGVIAVGTITAATSFVIDSSSGTDGSTVSWMVVES